MSRFPRFPQRVAVVARNPSRREVRRMATARERIRHPLRTRDETNDDRRDDDRYDEHVRDRRRERYGGINWGAAFFGWVTAVGIGALLTALVSAAGAAIGFTEISDTANGDLETIGLVGGILLIAVALIAYFAGGYVAGRMSRFDGARQGFATWLWAVIAVIVLAIVGAIAGSEYNLFADIDLPRIPVDEGDVTTGGAITLILIALGTLLAAMAGGKAGQRYHTRVDRAGYERD